MQHPTAHTCKALPYLPSPARLQARLSRPSRHARLRLHAQLQPTPEEMQKQYEEAMKDPEARKRMQAAEQQLQDPEVQRQMQEMQAALQNPEIMQSISELQQDPDIGPMLAEAMKAGVPGLMKLMNDRTFVAKVGSVVGDVDLAGGLTGPQERQPPPASTYSAEVVNLFDAAKAGDLEAVEDFLSVGKDVNEQDAEGRTPLHYAVAYQKDEVMQELLRAGGSLTAQDKSQNTPLHYAAGYGRARFIKPLLDAGADGSLKNDAGLTAYALVKSAVQNPINMDEAALKLLEKAAAAASVA